MAITVICFILLVMYVPISRSKTCQIRNQRNETKDVCCADYEKRGYDCIACLEGYTSETGHNCKPCPKNTYGERCRYQCSCSDFEVCDNVKGCVLVSPTTGSSFVATSDTFIRRISNKSCDRTTASDKKEKVCCADFEEKESGCIDDMSLKLFTRAATDYEDDISSSQDEVNTNGESTDCSIKGPLSREIIVYSALSVIVSVFGICLCFVFLKYRTLTKKYLVTSSQTRNTLIPQQIQPHETADRLYDIINEEDILDNRRLQQMQMSPNYLDVIHDSNTRDSCESKSLDNQDNPCQLLSIIQTQTQEHNLKVDDRSLMSGDSTSSSNEYQWDSTQNYLNPYQPMIEISPPAERKYLTIATAHSSVDGDYTDSAIVRYEYELQHSREVENKAYTNDNYENFSVSFGSNESKSLSNRKGRKESESYENLNVERFKMTSNFGKEDKKDEIE